MKSIVGGFDFHGVILNIPLCNLWKSIGLNYFFIRYLREMKLVNISFCKFFNINKKIVSIQRRLSKEGHKILIISGYCCEHAKYLENLLRKNNVPFDELHLMSSDSKSYFHFVLDRIIKTSCDYYVGDNLDLIAFLKKSQNKCRAVYFENNKFFQMA